jgi:hypothetical protein
MSKQQVIVIEPSDAERSTWAFQTEAYVCGLEAENARLKEELEKHRWIPVTERLPDKTGSYQVLRENNSYPTTREYYPDDSQWTSRDVVTHWKPIILPEKQ